MYAHRLWCMLEVSLQELVLCPDHVGSRNRTQTLTLSGKYLYPTSHLAGPGWFLHDWLPNAQKWLLGSFITWCWQSIFLLRPLVKASHSSGLEGRGTEGLDDFKIYPPSGLRGSCLSTLCSQKSASSTNVPVPCCPRIFPLPAPSALPHITSGLSILFTELQLRERTDP